MLVIDDWKITAVIHDSNTINSEKYWISKLPDFDIEEFPFLIVSGRESFNLINIVRATCQPLIKASSKNLYGQTAAFFIMASDEEKINGKAAFIMHFATKKITAVNTRLSQWHHMTFRSDFIDRL